MSLELYALPNRVSPLLTTDSLLTTDRASATGTGHKTMAEVRTAMNLSPAVSVNAAATDAATTMALCNQLRAALIARGIVV